MAQRITNQTIHNPQMLRKVLESMDTELDSVRTLINELRTDHATYRSAVSQEKTIMGQICLSPAGLAIGVGSKKKILIANTTYYMISGVIKTKTTAEIDFTATTHDVANGSSAYFVLSINSAGTVTITKGADGGTLTQVTPSIPSNQAIIGYLTIAASGAIFDATSDDLDAAHLTVTYYDTGFLPTQIGNAPDTISAAAVTEQVEHGS